MNIFNFIVAQDNFTDQKQQHTHKKMLSEVIVIFLTVLNVNLKNRLLLLKHSSLKHSGQQH